MTLLRPLSLLAALALLGAPALHAQRLAPSAVVALASTTPLVATVAPPQRSTGTSVARAIAGGLVGGGLGALAGGYAGAVLNASRDECSGNPDYCSGYLVEGLVVGAMAGHALGIPVGAHLANGRRSSLLTSLLVSGGIFAAELVAVNALTENDRISNRSALFGVMAAAPVAQLVSSAIIEARAR